VIVMNPNLTISQEKIRELCVRFHIGRVAVFGSALRDDFTPDSDVDVLVDFLPGHTPGFFGLFDIEEELSAIFGGRKTELRTSQDLSKHFRQRVLDTAEVQYVR
jgi:predicted nucleotidyltransferase